MSPSPRCVIMDRIKALFTALRFGDSLFPSGSFAYSSGLETYVGQGLVKDRRGLVLFVEAYLSGLVSHCDSVFVRLSHDAGLRSDLRRLVRYDSTLEAMKVARELREASIQTGRQTLQVALNLYESSLLAAMAEAIAGKALHGHHPVIFGTVGAVSGMDPDMTVLTHLYATVSTLVSAGIRLIPLGHTDGQKALADLEPSLCSIVTQGRGMAEEDISSFAPGLEIRAMQHEHLYSRLFKS